MWNENVLTAKEEIDRLTVRCERQRERAERWTVKYNDLRDRYDRLTELFYHNEDKIDQLFAEYEALLQQTEREKDQEIIDLENQVHLKERQVRETENTYYKYGYGEALDDNRRAIRLGQKELKKDYEKRLQAKVDKLICGIFWQDDGEPVQWLRRAIKRVNGVAGNCPVIINDESYECEYKGEAGYHTTPSGKTVVNHPGAYGYRTVYHCSTERLEVGVGWINRNIKKLAMSEAKMKVKK